MSIVELCPYCGTRPVTDREHVFPKCLYPAGTEYSGVQLLTIPSCNTCNNGWSDDETHFRLVLSLAGEQNRARKQLWESKISRSLERRDAERRIRDLMEIMRPVIVDGQELHKIYPGEDERVLRIIRKIVKGLCYHHMGLAAVPEARVWADTLKYTVPDDIWESMTYEHRDKEIVEYRHLLLQSDDIHSAWIMMFFEKVEFIGVVMIHGQCLDAAKPEIAVR